MLKKQKRDSRKDKNVVNVFKAEDVDGHKYEDNIDNILEVRELVDPVLVLALTVPDHD